MDGSQLTSRWFPYNQDQYKLQKLLPEVLETVHLFSMQNWFEAVQNTSAQSFCSQLIIVYIGHWKDTGFLWLFDSKVFQTSLALLLFFGLINVEGILAFAVSLMKLDAHGY